MDEYILIAMAYYFTVTWEMETSDKAQELMSEEWLSPRHRERLRRLRSREKMFRVFQYLIIAVFVAQVALDIAKNI